MNKNNSKPWTRSANGVLAGVCVAMSQRFQVDVMLIRLALLFAILIYGVGLGLYILAAIGLPREDKLQAAQEPRVFGVCVRFAQRFDLDLGLTRVGALLLLFCSMGVALPAYIVLYFVLPKPAEISHTNPQKFVE
jgi:phage shock protein PspC (stress-responsive transcriptional regulator)